MSGPGMYSSSSRMAPAKARTRRSFSASGPPGSELERLVADLEGWLTARETTRAHPELGEDVKILGVRHGGGIRLTLACAFVDRHGRRSRAPP